MSADNQSASDICSFDLGHAHFIGFSTEFYYRGTGLHLGLLAPQYKWLEEDLQVRAFHHDRLHSANLEGQQEQGESALDHHIGTPPDVLCHE